MVRKERQRSSSPQLARFSNDSPQLKQASTPLYRTRQPRYTIPHICGHRQVVRHQLPKLTLAGSSPVARSSKKHKHDSVTLPCFLLLSAGTRTRQGASVKQTRSVCSEQAKAVRICEANTRTSRCPLHGAQKTSGRPIQQSLPHRHRESEGIDRSRCGFAKQITQTSRCSLQFQNVRLMPAAHTCTCARYNGWVTTNVPITKKEPL